jgi:hypothetical protein
MDSMDLNINNYDFEDLLNLFEININFTEEDLKNCKKKVLQMHPDKSDLNKDFFLFFSKAYKIIFSVYKFKMDSKDNINDIDFEYNPDDDNKNDEIINNLKKNNKFYGDNFNKWFNKLFDEIHINNDYNNNGYGNWMKDNNENMEVATNLDSMNRIIDEKKNKLRDKQLINYKGINEVNNNSYCDIANSRPDSYSSDIFSKFQFEDLKLAHEESVVPVTSKDFNPSNKTFDELKNERQKESLNPLNKKDAENYLKGKLDSENNINSYRAYNLYKQNENNNKIQNSFWSSLKQLK